MGGSIKMRRKQTTNWLILLLLIAVVAFVGNIVGEVVRPYVPFAGNYAPLELEPVRFGVLGIITLTFGFTFRLNLVGAVFALVGLVWSLRK
jgi:hypothetical protein